MDFKAILLGLGLTVNVLAQDIPTKIEDYASVSQYIVDGSIHKIVHVKQRHIMDKLDKNTESLFRKVNTTQKEIYKILNEFSRIGLIQVHAEGVFFNSPYSKSENYFEEYSERMELVDRVFERKPRMAAFTIKYLIENPICDDYKEKIIESYKEMENYRYIPGGHLLLGLEGRIFLTPSEKEEDYWKASKDSSYNFNEREDFVIENILNDGENIHILVFGNAHDFKDNIEKYNKENKETVSLITITPNSLR